MWDLKTIKNINTDEMILKRLKRARQMNRVRKLLKDDRPRPAVSGSH